MWVALRLQDESRVVSGVGGVEPELEIVSAGADAGAESHADRRTFAPQVLEDHPRPVGAARSLEPVQEHILEVLAAALLVPARAVALFHEPAREGSPGFGELAVRIGDAQVHVRGRRVPGDHELHGTGVDPAALVDDAVAVVVDRVEAALGAARHASALEREGRAVRARRVAARRARARHRSPRTREPRDQHESERRGEFHFLSSGTMTPDTSFGFMSSKYASRAS